MSKTEQGNFLLHNGSRGTFWAHLVDDLKFQMKRLFVFALILAGSAAVAGLISGIGAAWGHIPLRF
ncbi:MAG: hypothetical protein KGO02_15765 [Alphaproteobacteria bacterium]|nr:hypothetical protein [Alphaproteobacteria bacterium]